jgi:hypothetical protein
MNFFKQILILFFASVIFFGTVGVNVFAHYCKIDGVDYSFIVPKDDHCFKEAAEESCCLSKVEISTDEEQLNENCCSDEMTSFKIASEIFQKEINAHQFIAVSASVPLLVYAVVVKDFAPDFDYFNFRQPIPKSGRDLLIQNQIFTI